MEEAESAENGSRLHEQHGESSKRKKEENMKENKKKKKKKPTVSIAVPGSIIDNAQSLELATLLAGQIARAATIFRIDESLMFRNVGIKIIDGEVFDKMSVMQRFHGYGQVVVFDNKAASDDESLVTNGDESEIGAPFLVRILQYLETPQYLRRRLFPMHNSLRFVGLLPPLDAPHHVRKHEWSLYREGVTLEGNHLKGTLVDVGLSKNVVVEQAIKPGQRVTVAMGTNRNIESDCLKKVVTPSIPREQMGLYWGYKVRYASNLSCVFKNCPFKGGYDHIIGTSEHGLVVNSSELIIPPFRHLLISFGGLGGLEESIEEDGNLKGKSVHDVFSSYLNTCPLQGSRTIRTEENIECRPKHVVVFPSQIVNIMQCIDEQLEAIQLELYVLRYGN